MLIAIDNIVNINGFGEQKLSNKQKLVDFLQQVCRERGCSIRRLSVNSGLSSATVHNIIYKEHQPDLSSLNRLADYLGVKREYLWQLAGLLEGMDREAETTFSDKQTRVTIDVVQETKDGLDFIRRPGQTYNGVIQELMELWKRQVWETTRVPSPVEIGQRG